MEDTGMGSACQSIVSSMERGLDNPKIVAIIAPHRGVICAIICTH